MGSFLLGFGLGVVGGILIAPQPGRYYRRMLSDKAGESYDYVKRQTESIRGTASDAMERGKEAVGEQVEKLTSAANQPAEVFQR